MSLFCETRYAQVSSSEQVSISPTKSGCLAPHQTRWNSTALCGVFGSGLHDHSDEDALVGRPSSTVITSCVRPQSCGFSRHVLGTPVWPLVCLSLKTCDLALLHPLLLETRTPGPCELASEVTQLASGSCGVMCSHRPCRCPNRGPLQEAIPGPGLRPGLARRAAGMSASCLFSLPRMQEASRSGFCLAAVESLSP